MSAAQKFLYGEFMSPASPVFFARFLTTFGVPRQICVEVANVKLYGNPLNGCRSDAGGRMIGQTDMKKVMGALREYVSASEQCLGVLG